MKRTSSAAQARDITRPAFTITVDGTPLPIEVALQVSRITVDEDVGLPSMFSVELAGGDTNNETVWIDGNTFPIGAAVEIKMGYGNTLQTLIAAEITGIEPVFTSGVRPSLTVRGHDRRHRLLRVRKTRSFVQQKDSDIAATLAAEAGLTAQTEDSQVVHDYVLQANQTNMEFLQERARRIEYEIVIEGKTLYFRPVQNAQGEVLTLTPEDDLLEFYPRLSTLGQSSEIELRGWNPKDKKEIVAKAKKGDEVSTMGGKDSGAALAENAFGAATVLLSDVPVFAQAEADQLVRACFNRSVLGLISGDGVCSGRTDLRPGQVIKIDGVGKRFSGQYYVTATSHRYTAHHDYQTHFVVRRNAT
ncbi:MAG: contractile injection system protein, VgrG/Pvc8 family [Candidatus Competibacteraceae bacterium]